MTQDSIASSHLLTPSEAAHLMSQRAGFPITPDDIKQLRRSGKIIAAKQLARTTLYEKREIEQAPLPMKDDSKSFSPEEQDTLLIHEMSSNNKEKKSFEKTWRTLLAEVIQDPLEHSRLARTLQVNPVTLTRWANGASTPRNHALRLLSEALPQLHTHIDQLLEKEDFVSKPRVIEPIHSDFYYNLFNIYTKNASNTQALSVSDLIQNHLRDHLKTPYNGIKVLVAQCVSPTPGHKVRSLSTIVPWKSRDKIQFFGVESPIGQAVFFGRSITIHTKVMRIKEFSDYHFPLDAEQPEEISFVAYPILRANCRIAGCLYVASSQPNYFSMQHIDLIHHYANLLTLCFENNEFYEEQDIRLGRMPDYQSQLPFLENLPIRTKKLMQDKNSPQTWSQATQCVWQELESEFLTM